MADFSKIGKSNVATAKSHERHVAKLLTEWTDNKFRRRRVEGRGNDTIVVNSTGDIISATDKKCCFNVECKKGKGFSLNATLASPQTALFCKWWHQTTYDAKLASDVIKTTIYPMLFFKPKPQHDWVAIQDGLFDIKFPHIVFRFDTKNIVESNISHSPTHKVMVKLALSDCVICRWKDFRDNIDPQLFFIKG